MNRQRNVAKIKRLMEGKKETYSRLRLFLISKGILPSLAEKVSLEFMQSAKEMGVLPQILANYIHTGPDLTFEKKKCIALVGPTGVGKTTTILKLAQHYSEQQKQVAILSLDKKTQSYGFPLLEKPEGDFDLILVDTEGCNFYQEKRVDSLGERLAEIPNVEVHLTLSAATKEVDLYGAIHQFSALEPTNLIFTKLDETLTLGTILNICSKCELPIRYVTCGKLEVARSLFIVRKMLADLNGEEFQQLRHLLI